VRRLWAGHQLLGGCSLRLGPLGEALRDGLSATLRILSKRLGPISEEQALSRYTYLRVRGPELHAGAEYEAERVVERHLGCAQSRSRSSRCELSQCEIESKDSIEFWVATYRKVRQQ
jgi:hypothetical protein